MEEKENNNLNEKNDDISNTTYSGEVSNKEFVGDPTQESTQASQTGTSFSSIRTNGTGFPNTIANASDKITNAAKGLENGIGKRADLANKKAERLNNGNEKDKEKAKKAQDLSDRLSDKKDKLNKGTSKLNNLNDKIQKNRNIFNFARNPGMLGSAAKDVVKNKIGETLNKGIKKVFEKIALKNPAVWAIIGGFVFLIIIAAALGGIDEDDFSITDSGCTSISSGNTDMWWPIGSEETTVSNGIYFATGNPSCTYISSGWGPRNCSVCSKYHKAIDITCGGVGSIIGKNIIAVLDGTVIFAGAQSGYGNSIKIDHGNGIVTRYSHMYSNGVYVKKGDKVKQGQVIGAVGNAGNSTGPHLDFGIYINGEASNPVDHVSASNPRLTSSNAVVQNTCSSSISGGSVAGNSDTQTICLTMKNWGLSDEAVAGIMGNMQKESSFKASSVNSRGCVGLVQWCDGRKTSVKNTLRDSWTNVEKQLDYINYEITQTSEKGVLKYLQSDADAATMAYNFCNVYERPEAGECGNGSRQNYAKNWYPYVKNGCSN